MARTRSIRCTGNTNVVKILNKFNEVIRFQQNLASAIEQQQIFNEQKTTVSTLEAEENAEAKSWFNG